MHSFFPRPIAKERAKKNVKTHMQPSYFEVHITRDSQHTKASTGTKKIEHTKQTKRNKQAQRATAKRNE